AAAGAQADRGARRNGEPRVKTTVAGRDAALEVKVAAVHREVRAEEAVVGGAGQPGLTVLRVARTQDDVGAVQVGREAAVLERDGGVHREARLAQGGDEAEAGPADEGEGDRHADGQGEPAPRRHAQHGGRA